MHESAKYKQLVLGQYVALASVSACSYLSMAYRNFIVSSVVRGALKTWIKVVFPYSPWSGKEEAKTQWHL